jgi:hypothetical protein
MKNLLSKNNFKMANNSKKYLTTQHKWTGYQSVPLLFLYNLTSGQPQSQVFVSTFEYFGEKKCIKETKKQDTEDTVLTSTGTVQWESKV